MIGPISQASPNRSSRSAFGNLSLTHKVALIPALTLLLLVLILTVAMWMGERNTAALRALDRNVFEPLNRAQTLKDQITLLHTHLFALLSMGNNETDPVRQQADANALLVQLDAETANFRNFLDANQAITSSVASRLRREFAQYAERAHETASFAAYDASYGELLVGVTNDEFATLVSDLDTLVQSLALRRAALATEAVSNSLSARRTMLVLGLSATLITLLGSIAVGRGIAQPIFRLTEMMNQLANGDSDLAVPGAERGDEVGAMANAVEVFRATLIAFRRGEIALRRTNVLLDAALNSMLQGMVVWGPDHRVQLVNKRFFEITGLSEDSVAPGMTPGELIEVQSRHGLVFGETSIEVTEAVMTRLTARRSIKSEEEMRPGLFVQIASEPMANGGTVVTFEDVSEKRRKEAQIVFMARHDGLTGLPNRTLFNEYMEAMVGKAGNGQSFAVLCLDLDHFKEVNDTLGHPVGDELLQLVAGRLRHSVRENDMVARLGGDEFAVVVPDQHGGQTIAAALADRLVDAISAPYDIQGHNIVIGTSIGIALSEPGVSAADMLKHADVALYRAKEGRGTFAFFEAGMDERLQARRGMEADLRQALRRGEFELDYQPLYNLLQDRVTGFEALVRWNSPTRGRVSPADFIPLAEQTGLIVAIGEWVLLTACAEATLWPDHVRVAVNLSAIQTRNQHLLALVRGTLDQTGLPPSRLELEITETVLLQDTDSVMTMLHSLHDMGVRVAMDDFGTGYSSLSYLRRFPFDKIKIDRSFISDLSGPSHAGEGGATAHMLTTAGESAATIVRAIVGLGNNLGISVTAEGVETAQQFAQVRQNGCAEVQGYFISRPRPANEVLRLLHRLDTTLPAIASSRAEAPQRVA